MALESFRASLAIAECLTKADPGNAEWQRDLSVSHDRIGDVLQSQGNLSAALESYKAALAIRERLAKADPSNAGWQRDLARTLSNVANVQMITHKREEALANYNRALDISEKLVSVIEAADVKSDGRAGRATASELGNVAMYALLARDYAKALAAADRALSITPNELGIETNRAHALMFLGRNREAMTLYLAHKGERVAAGANKPWQQVFAEDFRDIA